MSPSVNRLRFSCLLLLMSLGAPQASALARPVVCSTTLEAPQGLLTDDGHDDGDRDGAPALPVEVTRCAPVLSTPALMEERFYTWTAPFASSVDVLHQVTDLLGIAVGGAQGNRLMGFGFPDQTIVWDGSAVQNTYEVLLEQQSDPIPWRTVDISNGFDSSLAEEFQSPSPNPTPTDGTFPPVRALW